MTLWKVVRSLEKSPGWRYIENMSDTLRNVSEWLFQIRSISDEHLDTSHRTENTWQSEISSSERDRGALLETGGDLG